MTTPTFTSRNIVDYAINKDAVNLKAAFDHIVGQKVIDTIDARKQHVASTMFNSPEGIEQEQPDGEEVEAAELDASSSSQEDAGNEQVNQETEESDEDTQVNN